MAARTLVLASASPARLATLHSAGVDPVVVVSGVDESAYDVPDPTDLADVLARAKARAVAVHPDTPAGALVLGCDSVLDLDGQAYGKPGDAGEATRRWKLMRGRSGVLVTGHCVVDLATGREEAAVARTGVTFADLSDEEIAAYVATGEPLDVAGAFTIDGLGGPFVTRVDGDPHTVVGLSLPLLRELLLRLDVPWPSLWRP